MKRPTANHFGGCSQMLVDDCQRPLDDIWCISKLCTARSRCTQHPLKPYGPPGVAKAAYPPSGEWVGLDARTITAGPSACPSTPLYACGKGCSTMRRGDSWVHPFLFLLGRTQMSWRSLLSLQYSR